MRILWIYRLYLNVTTPKTLKQIQNSSLKTLANPKIATLTRKESVTSAILPCIKMQLILFVFLRTYRYFTNCNIYSIDLKGSFYYFQFES